MATNQGNRRNRGVRPTSAFSPPGLQGWLRPFRTVVVAGAVAVALVACAAEPPEVTIDDPVLVEGREVYGKSCASCHGSDGGGGVGRKLSDGAVTTTFPSIADQIDLVANGRNAMPAYGDRLTEEQIEAVVRYTREVL